MGPWWPTARRRPVVDPTLEAAVASRGYGRVCIDVLPLRIWSGLATGAAVSGSPSRAAVLAVALIQPIEDPKPSRFVIAHSAGRS